MVGEGGAHRIQIQTVPVMIEAQQMVCSPEESPNTLVQMTIHPTLLKIRATLRIQGPAISMVVGSENQLWVIKLFCAFNAGFERKTLGTNVTLHATVNSGLIHPPCQAKICDFGNEIREHENVPGCKISMNDLSDKDVAINFRSRMSKRENKEQLDFGDLFRSNMLHSRGDLLTKMD